MVRMIIPIIIQRWKNPTWNAVGRVDTVRLMGFGVRNILVRFLLTIEITQSVFTTIGMKLIIKIKEI